MHSEEEEERKRRKPHTGSAGVPAGILRRKASTVSERPRRRVVPWERRRLAGIFSAFQALFFFVVFSEIARNNLTEFQTRKESPRHRVSNVSSRARGCPLSHVLFEKKDPKKKLGAPGQAWERGKLFRAI